MKKYLFYTVIIFLAFGCQEVERESPVSPNDTAPGEVTNVKVKNIPGGAILNYTLPDSKGLLYVLAEYSIRDSVTLQKKASYYKNSITVDGFPSTNAYDVKLYAVSRGEKKSAPVTVLINPLTPPVISVFQSIRMRAAFGGVNVQFANENEANVKINVLTPDSLGDLSTADIFYTSIDSGDFSVRGYDSVNRRFGVFVRDRWNNYSDTVYADIKPFYEVKLDKSKFQGTPLPNDTYEQHTGGEFSNLWDDVWNITDPVFHTKPIAGNMPQWFTFDLGVKVRLSRFKFYHRKTRRSDLLGGAYYDGDPKVFEIWGSNNPDSDGSWASWTLLGHFNSVKPSGKTPPTSEDLTFANVEGGNFEFPLGIQPYRYLRFKTLETWGGVDYMYIAELTFWGSEK